ncbi:hypothetical protein [Chromobacterium amazonense]|uniref:hypothetical protein n=1 Tax=Chromobacterium amazonense TaxID=1382803 RepID=UPI0011B27AF7|nr:hypothetical protein [Chromobacterium amazonense]
MRAEYDKKETDALSTRLQGPINSYQSGGGLRPLVYGLESGGRADLRMAMRQEAWQHQAHPFDSDPVTATKGPVTVEP